MEAKGVRPPPLKKPGTSPHADVSPKPRRTNSASLTPGPTPSPGSRSFGYTWGISGPWVVSPPPPPGLQAERAASVVTSPGNWVQQTLRERGACSLALAISLTLLVFTISLGAYAVLVFLAITTRNPRYIAFTGVLAGIFLLIVCVVLSSGQPPQPPTVGKAEQPQDNSSDENKSEERDKYEIFRSFGLQPSYHSEC
ncbi:unnamed protein product [Ascophyllum nodosum]